MLRILYMKTYGQKALKKGSQMSNLETYQCKNCNIVYNQCVIRRQKVEGGRGGRVIRFIRGMTTSASGRCLVVVLIMIIIFYEFSSSRILHNFFQKSDGLDHINHIFSESISPRLTTLTTWTTWTTWTIWTSCL